MEKLEPQVKNTRWTLQFVVCLLFIYPGLSSGQQKSLFDYISSYDSLELFVETDFRGLLRKKDKYQPAHIHINTTNKEVIDVDGEIRSRGNMRKNICYMPPTKLRFTKTYLAENKWRDYPTLKVVNCCAFNHLSETYVELEYLIYDIYNLLTDRSFNVCKTTLNYIDITGKRKPVNFDGFLIEHEDQLADRLDGEIYEGSFFKVTQLDRKAYILFSMFQFMIGNTDWKVLNKHNLEIVKVEKDRTCYPIPYDFDYSGLVHATYAVPNESLPIKSVTDRIYLGPCQSQEEVLEMCIFFRSKKEQIFSLVDKILSDEKENRACKNYLEDFFAIVADEKNAKAIFMNCRDY